MSYKREFLSSLVVVLFLCCGDLSRNDIYKIIPKGTVLSLDLLKKSRQIVPNESDLILNYDLSTEWNRFDPHLLFYDDELKLYAASYFPSHQIESLESNVIVGVLHQANEKRKKDFRNQLPKEYKTKFISRKVDGGLRISNKIVESIEIQPNKQSLKLFVRVSKDKLVGLRWNKYNIDDKGFANKFVGIDTLNYFFTELNFNYEEGIIFTTHQGPGNKLVQDNILIPHISILENFYNDLISSYTK